LHGFNPDTKNPDNYSTTTITPTWGIQRKVGKKLSFEFNAGLSINYFDDDQEWFTGPALGVKLGYVLK
jgi:hypothetical protein